MKVAVIGASVSGFVSAIQLARKGIEVSIYEKRSQLGGRMKSFKLNGFDFEVGPVMITSPKTITQFFEAIDRNIDDYLTIKQVKHHTQNKFSDNTPFLLSTDQRLMVRQLRKIDPIGANNYLDFLKEITKMKFAMNEIADMPPLTNWRQLLMPPARSAYLTLKPFETIDRLVRRYFTNEKVIQMFTRYAAYNGLNPTETPAMFITQAYDELLEGVYYIPGGNLRLLKALEMIAREEGVNFYTEKEVTKIHTDGNEVKGVCLNDDLSLEVDAIIMNQLDFKQQKHLLEPSLSIEEETPTAVATCVLFLALNIHTPFHQHQVLHSNDVLEEFEAIQQGIVPPDPTVYIYNPAYSEENRFVKGDALLLFVNMPYTTDEQAIYTMKEQILKKLAQYDIHQKNISAEQFWTPEEMHHHFEKYRQSGPMRKMTQLILNPFLKEFPYKGLYFTGMQPFPANSLATSVRNGQIMANRLYEEMVQQKNRAN